MAVDVALWSVSYLALPSLPGRLDTMREFAAHKLAHTVAATTGVGNFADAFLTVLEDAVADKEPRATALRSRIQKPKAREMLHCRFATGMDLIVTVAPSWCEQPCDPAEFWGRLAAEAVKCSPALGAAALRSFFERVFDPLVDCGPCGPSGPSGPSNPFVPSGPLDLSDALGPATAAYFWDWGCGPPCRWVVSWTVGDAKSFSAGLAEEYEVEAPFGRFDLALCSAVCSMVSQLSAASMDVRRSHMSVVGTGHFTCSRTIGRRRMRFDLRVSEDKTPGWMSGVDDSFWRRLQAAVVAVVPDAPCVRTAFETRFGAIRTVSAADDGVHNFAATSRAPIYLCPITRKPVADPVCTVYGSVCERTALMDLFAGESVPTDPVTGDPLETPQWWCVPRDEFEVHVRGGTVATDLRRVLWDMVLGSVV